MSKYERLKNRLRSGKFDPILMNGDIAESLDLVPKLCLWRRGRGGVSSSSSRKDTWSAAYHEQWTAPNYTGSVVDALSIAPESVHFTEILSKAMDALPSFSKHQETTITLFIHCVLITALEALELEEEE